MPICFRMRSRNGKRKVKQTQGNNTLPGLKRTCILTRSSLLCAYLSHVHTNTFRYIHRFTHVVYAYVSRMVINAFHNWFQLNRCCRIAKNIHSFLCWNWTEFWLLLSVIPWSRCPAVDKWIYGAIVKTKFIASETVLFYVDWKTRKSRLSFHSDFLSGLLPPFPLSLEPPRTGTQTSSLCFHSRDISINIPHTSYSKSLTTYRNASAQKLVTLVMNILLIWLCFLNICTVLNAFH